MKHSKIQVRIWLAGIAATLIVAAAGVGFGPARVATSPESRTSTAADSPNAQAPSTQPH